MQQNNFNTYSNHNFAASHDEFLDVQAMTSIGTAYYPEALGLVWEELGSLQHYFTSTTC